MLALLAVMLWPRLLASPRRVATGSDTAYSEPVLFIDKQENAPSLYEGKCYVPVHKKKPEPRSVKH